MINDLTGIDASGAVRVAGSQMNLFAYIYIAMGFGGSCPLII